MKLKGIDPRVTLPPYDEDVLVMLDGGCLCVAQRHNFLRQKDGEKYKDAPDGWDPQGDIGENSYRIDEILWWADIPEIVPPVGVLD